MGSSASLNRSPRKNWVEDAGELPPYIREIARSIERKRGMPLSQAIPIAIAQVKKWAAGGENVSAATRAKAAKAVAAWEALKAKNAVREAPKGALGMWLEGDELGDLSLLEAAAMGPKRAGVTVNGAATGGKKGRTGGKTAGQQLAGRAKKPAAKTRSGQDQDFEKKHPRGRGGSWVLKAGSKGDDVKAVQSRVGGVKADGEYGSKTAAAIRAFQRKHGLTVDGVVGHQTAVALAGNHKTARTAKVGALKGSDRAKLKAMRGRS